MGFCFRSSSVSQNVDIRAFLHQPEIIHAHESTE